VKATISEARHAVLASGIFRKRCSCMLLLPLPAHLFVRSRELTKALCWLCVSIGNTDKKKEDEETVDEFTRLKKISGKQIAEIRRTITERDDLISSSSGSGGKAAVQLSARVRYVLSEFLICIYVCIYIYIYIHIYIISI
jgi:hypothetical protein